MGIREIKCVGKCEFCGEGDIIMLEDDLFFYFECTNCDAVMYFEKAVIYEFDLRDIYLNKKKEG